MVDAYLFQDETDPRTTYSVSLWNAAEKLLAYHTSDDARKREENLAGHVEHTDGGRGFVAWKAAEIPHGGMRRWLLVPAAIALAGGAAFALVRRLRDNGEDRADGRQRETESARHDHDPDHGNGRGRTATVTPLAPPAVRPAVSGNASAPEPHMQRTAMATDTGATRTTTGGNPSPSAPRRPNQLVRDVMTENPRCVNHDDSLEEAARLMRDLNVGFVPVMAGGKLAGVLTDRDITLGLADTSRDRAAMKAGDLMTDVPVTISPHVSVEEAARLMADHQVRRLPVVEGTRLVGIIALGDIAEESPNRVAGDALEDISQPARPDR